MKNLNQSVAAAVTNNSTNVVKSPISSTKPDRVSSVEKYFTEIMAADTNMSAAIAAIKTLLRVLEDTNCKHINKI